MKRKLVFLGVGRQSEVIPFVQTTLWKGVMITNIIPAWETSSLHINQRTGICTNIIMDNPILMMIVKPSVGMHK